ncbi:hypothetical protein HY346_01380, partial [Candidatus Microgenomates bacterium]|nr:hypothetical protein [Candidatus Microgenomates bacterium]
ALWWLQSWGVDLRSRLVQVVVVVLGQWLYQVALLLALWLDGGTFAWSAGFGLRGWLAGILTGAIVIVAGQKVQSLLGKSI